MEKTCTVCGETKPVDEYHKKKSGKYDKDGKKIRLFKSNDAEVK